MTEIDNDHNMTATYRGYTITTNSVATSVAWEGDFLDTFCGDDHLLHAKKVIDNWLSKK